MHIMVATRDGLHAIAPQRQTFFEGHEVGRLAWDGECTWAVTDGDTIWRGADDWEVVAKTDEFGVRCILPSTIGVLAGTSDGRVMRLDGSDLVALPGFDRVEGRDKWWQVGGLDEAANTRSLAQAPDGTLYANIHVGGIYRSRDLGATWEPTIDQETDVHEIQAFADGVVIAATGMAGLCISRDAGESWDSITEGLPTTSGWGLPYAALGRALGRRRARDRVERATERRSRRLPRPTRRRRRRSSAATTGFRRRSATTSTPAASRRAAESRRSAPPTARCTSPPTRASRGTPSPATSHPSSASRCTDLISQPTCVNRPRYTRRIDAGCV